jgi:uncharacterized protein
MTDATPGRFVWHDLMTPDPKAAVAFYTHVAGWTSQPFEGSYTMLVGSQGPMGGVAELPERARKRGAPPHWMGNVQVADVEATVAQVRQLGGEVYAEPQDIPNVGRYAIVADPQGAAISVFHPNRPMVLHDSTKAGEVCWNELISTDHEAGFAFYAKLFGWTKSRDFDMGPMGKYLIYGAGGTDLGGMFTRPLKPPSRSHWIYYFEVGDLDAAIDRAKSKGAKVVNGPMEVPGGARVAQLDDPQGAGFALHAAKKG